MPRKFGNVEQQISTQIVAFTMRFAWEDDDLRIIAPLIENNSFWRLPYSMFSRRDAWASKKSRRCSAGWDRRSWTWSSAVEWSGTSSSDRQTLDNALLQMWNWKNFTRIEIPEIEGKSRQNEFNKNSKNYFFSFRDKEDRTTYYMYICTYSRGQLFWHKCGVVGIMLLLQELKPSPPRYAFYRRMTNFQKCTTSLTINVLNKPFLIKLHC